MNPQEQAEAWHVGTRLSSRRNRGATLIVGSLSVPVDYW
jgi:hypothetical protein